MSKMLKAGTRWRVTFKRREREPEVWAVKSCDSGRVCFTSGWGFDLDALSFASDGIAYLTTPSGKVLISFIHIDN